jgi:DNA-binding transcriptional LysR family regulator
MELRHLRYFMAVAEHKSIRKAAERIFITQPAISRQLLDLEQQLGFSLFERLPRGLQLTPAGEYFHGEVQKILDDLDNAVLSAKRVAGGRLGHLRLGFVENAGWDGFMPSALRAFQAELPDTSLELLPANSPVQLQAIEEGTLDGGFIYAFKPLVTACEVLTLVNHDVVLAIPASWDIPGDVVELKQLAQLPFVTFPRHVYPAYHDCLLGACQQSGVSLRIVQQEQTESAILALVSSGVGAAIVNSANAGRPPALVRFLKLANFSISMPLSFAFQPGNRNPLLQRFVHTLQGMIQNSAGKNTVWTDA